MDAESFIPVEDEPLHKQRWKSDIVRLVCAQIPPNTTSLWHQHLKSGVYVCVGDLEGIEEARGADPKHLNVASGNVFCRDHTEDKLVHVITSHEKPIYMIEVELLKEKHQIKPNESIPVLEHAAVQCIEAKRECRVYRVNLAPTPCRANCRWSCPPTPCSLCSPSALCASSTRASHRPNRSTWTKSCV